MEQEEREERRNAFIKALRACADFYEEHPLIEAPVQTTFNVFVNTKEEIAVYARLAAWEKVYNEEWFSLRKVFGDSFQLEINATRETVCRKVVTGTRILPARPEQTVEIIEWICDEPLLAGAE